MTLTYIQSLDVLVVGANNSSTSKLMIFKLLNDEGIIGLQNVKTLDFNGLILEL